MRLLAINRDGTVAGRLNDPPAILGEVLPAMAALYRRAGHEAPWIGYVAEEGGVCVGTCAFKTPPRNNVVEIAYFTFPGHEGKGVATRMARTLIAMARRDRPAMVVKAHTAPEENASTAILRKLGFRHEGAVEDPEDGTVWAWVLD